MKSSKYSRKYVFAYPTFLNAPKKALMNYVKKNTLALLSIVNTISHYGEFKPVSNLNTKTYVGNFELVT